jgi:hypothetical protein
MSTSRDVDPNHVSEVDRSVTGAGARERDRSAKREGDLGKAGEHTKDGLRPDHTNREVRGTGTRLRDGLSSLNAKCASLSRHDV